MARLASRSLVGFADSSCSGSLSLVSLSLPGGFSISTGDEEQSDAVSLALSWVLSSGVKDMAAGKSGLPLLPGTEGGWEMVMTEDIDGGRPVSSQPPLKAASKNGEAKKRTSLCALS